MRNRPFAVWFISIVASLIAIALPSCKATQDGYHYDLGAVASVTAAADTGAKPPLLVRYDGDVFVAWATYAVDVTMYWRHSEPRSYALPPISIADGEVIVRVRSKDLQWQGTIDNPLPAATTVLFSPDEVSSWGLQFVLWPEP